MSVAPRLPLVAPVLALLVAACGSGAPGTPTASPDPSASPPPSASPTPQPSPSATPLPSDPPASGAVVVTFRVVGREQYRVLLTDPRDVAIARDHAAGREAPKIPNGRLIRGTTGVNTGHEWSIDPDDFEWADVTMELCDGIPSQIDDGTFAADRFCPWAAEVIEVEPYQGT